MFEICKDKEIKLRNNIKGIQVSSDENMLAVYFYNLAKINIYCMATFKQLLQINTRYEATNVKFFGKQQQYIVAGLLEKDTLTIWYIKQNKIQLIYSIRNNKNYIFSTLCLTNNSQQLVQGDQYGCIKFWNLVHQKKLVQLKIQNGIQSIAQSKCKKLVIVGDQQGKILIWSNIQQAQICEWQAHSAIFDLIISDDRFLLSTGLDSCIKLWDLFLMVKDPLQTEIKLFQLNENGFYFAVDFTIDFQQIYSINKTSIVVWDTSNCQTNSIQSNILVEQVINNRLAKFTIDKTALIITFQRENRICCYQTKK